MIRAIRISQAFFLTFAIWRMAGAVPYDDFSGRRIEATDVVTVRLALEGATVENGEPPVFGAGSVGTVWIEWTTPTAGDYNIQLDAPNRDAALQVFAGTKLSDLAGRNLVLVSQQHNDYTNWPSLYSNFSLATGRFPAMTGVSYFIRIENLTPGVSDGATLRIAPTPANDDVRNATEIAGEVAQPFSLLLAAREAFESSLNPELVRASLWWKWHAQNSGGYGFEFVPLTGGGYAGRWGLDVFRLKEGQSLDSNLLARAESGGLASVSAEAGASYLVRVWRPYAGTGNVGQFRIRAADANDRFADRIERTGESFSIAVNLAGATAEPDEPKHGANSLGNSLWYRWKCPRTRGYVLSDRAQTTATIFSVYTGVSLGELSRVAPLAAMSGVGLAQLSFRGVEGVEYAIAVDKAAGDGRISLTLGPGRQNDDFAAATLVKVSSLGATLQGSTIGASREPGEPVPEGVQDGRTVWYQIPDSPSGGWVAQVESQGIDPVYLLHRFQAAAGAWVEGSSVLGARLHIPTSAGRGHWLAVGSAGPTGGAFVLRLIPAEPNDSFLAPTSINALGQKVKGNLEGASSEPGEPLFQSPSIATATLWYRWIAPSNGVYAARLGPFPDIGTTRVLSVYEGDSMENLRLRARGGFEGGAVADFRAVFSAEAGEDFRIQVEGLLGIPVMPFELWITPGLANDRFDGRKIVEVGADFLITEYLASPDPGGPVDPELNSAPVSLWYTVPISRPGKYTIRAHRLFKAAVYRGESLATLEIVGGMESFDATDSYRFYVSQPGAYAVSISASAPNRIADNVALRIVETPSGSDSWKTPRTIASVPWEDSGWQGYLLDEEEKRLPGLLDGLPWWNVPGGRALAWYEFKSETGGEFFVTSYALRTALYRGGNFPNLDLIGIASLPRNVFFRPSYPDFPGVLRFTASPGERYLLAVVHGTELTAGRVMVNAVPDNDSFSKATVVGALPFFAATSTRGTLHELGEPVHGASKYSTGSLWYNWLCPESGNYLLRCKGSDGPIVAVYQGESIESLRRITNEVSVTTSDNTPALRLNAIAGRRYRIAIDGVFDMSQTTTLGGQFGIPIVEYPGGILEFVIAHEPEGDRSDAPIVLEGAEVDRQFSTVFATPEPDEYVGMGDHLPTVWFRWVAPESGVLEMISGQLNDLFHTKVEIFGPGDGVASGYPGTFLYQFLLGIGSTGTPAWEQAQVKKGQSYFLRAYTYQKVSTPIGSAKIVAKTTPFRLKLALHPGEGLQVPAAFPGENWDQTSGKSWRSVPDGSVAGGYRLNLALLNGDISVLKAIFREAGTLRFRYRLKAEFHAAAWVRVLRVDAHPPDRVTLGDDGEEVAIALEPSSNGEWREVRVPISSGGSHWIRWEVLQGQFEPLPSGSAEMDLADVQWTSGIPSRGLISISPNGTDGLGRRIVRMDHEFGSVPFRIECKDVDAAVWRELTPVLKPMETLQTTEILRSLPSVFQYPIPEGSRAAIFRIRYRVSSPLKLGVKY